MTRDRYLLDTNIVLLALSAPQRLTPKALKLLQKEDLHISVLVYWEVLIKSMKGKLAVGDVRQWWIDALTMLKAVPVPLHPDHISAIAGLPPLHKDPFDRALVAQAEFEHLTLITADALLLDYATARIRVLHAPILSE